MSSRLVPRPAAAVAALLLALAAPLAPAAERPLEFAAPQVAGQLAAPPRNEASGLAASRRDDDLLWTHDDSGGEPELYAVRRDGRLRGTLRLAGVKNTDWEDIASVDLDGKSWLVVGDIGDNDAKRKRVSIHFVEEPAVTALDVRRVTPATPAATVRIVFADGARDCESLAVDPTERAIYLLSKRDPTPRLYRVQLPPPPLASVDLTAEFLVPAPHVARNGGAADALLFGLIEKGRARPCGMDFAPDGSAAVVVTYVGVVVFPRAPGESWAEAFAGTPLHLVPHELPQAEAVCFARDGRAIFVASEETRKFLRYDRR